MPPKKYPFSGLDFILKLAIFNNNNKKSLKIFDTDNQIESWSLLTKIIWRLILIFLAFFFFYQKKQKKFKKKTKNKTKQKKTNDIHYSGILLILL